MALNNLGDVTDSGTLLTNTTAIVNAATTASTSVTITAVNSSLFVGQTVTGPGVQLANGIVGPTTITALSTDGLTLTLSNPATFAKGATLTFSSVYAPVTTAAVNGAISSTTTAVTIAASNSLIAAGQLVSGPGITGVNTVSSISTTSLVLSTSVTTVADKTGLTFWAPVTPNVAVDFVWKNLPIQPNDDRNNPNIANSGGAGVQNLYISAASKPTPGTIQFTTNAAHGLNVGDVISTGTYATTGTPAVTVTLTSVANTAGTVNFSYGNSNLTSATGQPQVGTVLVKTAGTGVFAPGGNVITSVDTVGKTFTVAVAPTTDFSSATLITAGFPVYSTTATFSSATKDATLLTQEITTSATHYIAPGTSVLLSGSSTPATYTASPNGSYVVLGASSKTKFTISTLTTTFTTNNIGSKDAAVVSSAVLSALSTLTYYPFDVKELKIISVPSTTTFIVASNVGWSGDSSDTGIGAQSSLTGSLALIADSSWADQTKVASARLDNGSINTTRNYLNYSTPTYDTYAMAAYGTFPNYIPGKFAVPSVTATTNYLVYSVVNNLTTSNTLNVTGISNPAFNQTGATIIAVKGDTIVTSNPSTTGTTASASTASNLVTLSAANNAIKVGMTVSGSGVSGTPKVVSVLGAVVTLDSAQTISSSVTLTFKVAAGTTLSGERGVASAANFGTASYIVSAVSGNGTTITYTAQNNLVPSDVVNITGLGNGAFNLSNATVASANATSFTVTNAGGSGITLTAQTGKVEYASAASNVDGGFVSGTYYPQIPSIIGQTATVAADTFNDRGLTGLVASAVTNGAVPTTTPKGNGSVSSAFARIAGSNVIEITASEAITGLTVSAASATNTVTRNGGTAIANVKVGQTVASTNITPARNVTAVDYTAGTITFDGAAVATIGASESLTFAGTGFVTGDQVIVSGGDATVNGDQTVIVKDFQTVLINTSSTAAYSGTTALTLTGKAGYVHAQSVAAGTQSQSPSTAVTYSVWG